MITAEATDELTTNKRKVDKFKSIVVDEIKRFKEEGIIPYNMPVTVNPTDPHQKQYDGCIKLTINSKRDEIPKQIDVEIPFEYSKDYRSDVKKFFTIYHELGHIYHQHYLNKKEEGESSLFQKEKEANCYAYNVLREKLHPNPKKLKELELIFHRNYEMELCKALKEGELHPFDVSDKDIRRYLMDNESFVIFLHYGSPMDLNIRRDVEMKRMEIELKKRRGKKSSVFNKMWLPVYDKFIKFVYGMDIEAKVEFS